MKSWPGRRSGRFRSRTETVQRQRPLFDPDRPLADLER
jgi:hypothetical protein